MAMFTVLVQVEDGYVRIPLARRLWEKSKMEGSSQPGRRRPGWAGLG